MLAKGSIEERKAAIIAIAVSRKEKENEILTVTKRKYISFCSLSFCLSVSGEKGPNHRYVQTCRNLN